jgi:hypothetical protein
MNTSTQVSAVGILLILLGIVIAITSWVIFPVCEMEGLLIETKAGVLLPMPCGYTARAETGIGALIVVAGGLLIARGSRETRQAVGIFTVAHGILVIAFPTILIGMCRMADHPCRQLTLPALEILGIAVIIIGVFLFWKRE